MEELTLCHDCAAAPGKPHKPGCDVERCSACGLQRLSCFCGGEHDPLFARWTGLWPGYAEARCLGITMNQLYDSGDYRFFFIKPKEGA